MIVNLQSEVAYGSLLQRPIFFHMIEYLIPPDECGTLKG